MGRGISDRCRAHPSPPLSLLRLHPLLSSSCAPSSARLPSPPLLEPHLVRMHRAHPHAAEHALCLIRHMYPLIAFVKASHAYTESSRRLEVWRSVKYVIHVGCVLAAWGETR